MSRINILDEVTAGQIAAGEVVERPVSVVKELIENSLDAGADQISIDISEGGKNGITVFDNGCGMSQEEVSLAFYRHATSKITCPQDLFSLTTLGFRGEALPSIAAVSHLVLKSRMPGENAGHRIELKGGEILSLQPTGCSVGTSVKVSDLFYNTPARRKHLKSTGTESGLIVSMVQNMSLARPDVGFLLKHNDRVVFRTSGSGKPLDAFSAVYGIDIAREMLQIETEQNSIKLSGYIGKPSVNRKTRSYITVVINGRYVKSKSISDAVNTAYRGLIPTGRYPIAVLALNLNPKLLDINIHPAKMEIRINDETEICEFIRHTIKDRLKNAILIPKYEARAQKVDSFGALRESQKVKSHWVLPHQQRSDSQATNNLSPVKNTNYLPDSFDYSPQNQNQEEKGMEQSVIQQSVIQQSVIQCEEESPAVAGKEKVFQRNMEEQHFKREEEPKFPLLQVIGQLLPTYILASGPDGLYILDQHAAHERVLFEKLLSSFQNSTHQTQMLLTPEPLELNYRNLGILQEKLNSFTALGFVLEEFGGGTYVLRGIPAYLSTGEGVKQFIDLIDDLGVLGQEKDFNRALIIRLACKAAIKSGEVMSLKTMEAIIDQLSGTAEPYTCPHGRPTLVRINEKELAQMFKRPN